MVVVTVFVMMVIKICVEGMVYGMLVEMHRLDVMLFIVAMVKLMVYKLLWVMRVVFMLNNFMFLRMRMSVDSRVFVVGLMFVIDQRETKVILEVNWFSMLVMVSSWLMVYRFEAKIVRDFFMLFEMVNWAIMMLLCNLMIVNRFMSHFLLVVNV